MKKVLLLGSRGFIGKNIYEGLKLSYEIETPDRAELDLCSEKSVLDYFKNKKYDCVIHAALYNERNTNNVPDLVLEQNLHMFFNLCKVEHHFSRCIIFGSGAEMNKAHGMKYIKESDFGISIPKDTYGFAKYIMNKFCLSSNKIVNMRLFGIFGPYEDYNSRFISNACFQALRGEPILINQNVVFSYLYIRDLIRILPYFMEEDLLYKDYNIVPNETIDLVTIGQIIKSISNSPFPITLKKQGLNLEYTASNERLLGQVGKFEFTSMNQAILELFEWYSKYGCK